MNLHPSTDPAPFGRLLRDRIRACGVRGTARATGLSPPVVSRVLRNLSAKPAAWEDQPAGRIVKIAAAVGLDVEIQERTRPVSLRLRPGRPPTPRPREAADPPRA